MTWHGEERRQNQIELEDLVARAAAKESGKVAEEVVRATVPAAVVETLKTFGIKADDPLSVQEHMHYLRESAVRSADPDVIADREFTRQTRLRCERFWQRVYDTLSVDLVRWFLWMFRWGIVAGIFASLISSGVDFKEILSLLR